MSRPAHPGSRPRCRRCRRGPGPTTPLPTCDAAGPTGPGRSVRSAPPGPRPPGPAPTRPRHPRPAHQARHTPGKSPATAPTRHSRAGHANPVRPKSTAKSPRHQAAEPPPQTSHAPLSSGLSQFRATVRFLLISQCESRPQRDSVDNPATCEARSRQVFGVHLLPLRNSRGIARESSSATFPPSITSSLRTTLYTATKRLSRHASPVARAAASDRDCVIPTAARTRPTRNDARPSGPSRCRWPASDTPQTLATTATHEVMCPITSRRETRGAPELEETAHAPQLPAPERAAADVAPVPRSADPDVVALLQLTDTKVQLTDTTATRRQRPQEQSA